VVGCHRHAPRSTLLNISRILGQPGAERGYDKTPKGAAFSSPVSWDPSEDSFQLWKQSLKKSHDLAQNEDGTPNMRRSVSYASSCSSAASAASGNSRAGGHSRRRRAPRRVRRTGKAAVKMPSRSSSGSRSRSDEELALIQSMYICECCPKKPKKFDNEDDLR
jgi:hypothetical protein